MTSPKTSKGWTNLRYLAGKIDSKTLIGRKVRVVSATNGWGAIEEGEEGVLKQISWDGTARADFVKQPAWFGKWNCFDVFMAGISVDEEDIL